MAPKIVIIVAMLALVAFFASMEYAFVCANKLKFEIQRKQGGLFGNIINVLLNHPAQHVTTIIVGKTLSMVACILAVVSLWAQFVPYVAGSPAWFLVTLLALAGLLLLFLCETLPEVMVKINPNAYFKALSPLLMVFYVVLYPFAWLCTWLSRGILRLTGLSPGESDALKGFDKVELEGLIEENGQEAGAEDEGLKIFQNALDFSDLRVRDCMVHRVDVEAVSIDATVEEITDRFIESKYSRIFVWESSIDNIVGYVNIRSLFRRPSSLREAMRKVRHVAATMKAEHVLQDFTKNRISVAVVSDEFGATAGIISLEDIIEQIVGDIDDEHDEQDLVEKVVGDNDYILSCRLEVGYLNEKYALDIEESDQYDTLAGYIIFHHNGIPPVGSVEMIGRHQIRVLRGSSARVDLVRVKLV